MKRALDSVKINKMRALNEIKFYHLLAIQHWPKWAVIGLLWLFSKTSLPIKLKITKFISKFFRYRFKKQTHIGKKNIAACFPELNDSARATLFKNCSKAASYSLFDFADAVFLSRKKLEARLIDVSGLEHLHAAQKKNRGVILFSGHFFHMPMLIRILALQTKNHVVFRPQRDPMYSWIINYAAKRNNGFFIEKNQIKKAIDCLNENQTILYFPDQNYHSREIVFSPFFDIPTASITALSRLANFNHSPVVPVFCYRIGETEKYKLEFLPEIELGHDFAQDAAKINQIIEKIIRKQPEKYMWFHPRFKTRPEGEPSFY